MPRGTGRLIEFKLSSAGVSELRRAAHHRLTVTVNVHDSASGKSAVRRLTLIPYSITGKGSTNPVVQGSGLQFLQGVGFVSSATGKAQFLIGCFAASPCRITTTVFANGHQIARSTPQYVGVDEVGVVHFKLSPAGRKMLAHARGNQLPVQIRLRDPAGNAAGRISLVAYR